MLTRRRPDDATAAVTPGFAVAAQVLPSTDVTSWSGSTTRNVDPLQITPSAVASERSSVQVVPSSDSRIAPSPAATSRDVEAATPWSANGGLPVGAARAVQVTPSGEVTMDCSPTATN